MGSLRRSLANRNRKIKKGQPSYWHSLDYTLLCTSTCYFLLFNGVGLVNFIVWKIQNIHQNFPHQLEEEIEKLVLKNRAHTLMLCRLMVRAEDLSSRSQLLKVLQKGETACLRLFLDYHGLRLIWSWMMDPATMSTLKVEVSNFYFSDGPV